MKNLEFHTTQSSPLFRMIKEIRKVCHLHIELHYGFFKLKATCSKKFESKGNWAIGNLKIDNVLGEGGISNRSANESPSLIISSWKIPVNPLANVSSIVHKWFISNWN